MNKTFSIVIVVVALIVIAVVLVVRSNNAPTTPVVVVTPTPGQASVPQGGAPVVVTNKNAIPADTVAVLTGNVSPNGANTTYWYEYGTTPNMGTKTPSQVIGSGFMTFNTPSFVTGLTKDTTYYFRLNAQNEFGQTSNGQYSFKTTHNVPSPVGSVPTAKTLSANGVSKSGANMNGEVTPNKSATDYWFEYGPTANLGNTSALVSAGSGETKVSASLSLSDLASSTTYYFRLNAQNQFGTVNGTTLNFKTK